MRYAREPRHARPTVGAAMDSPPKRRELSVWYLRLSLRCRSLWRAVMVVFLVAAGFAATSAGEAPASTRAAPGAPTETALLHRPATCLAPGQGTPVGVLGHRALGDAS